MKPGPRGRGALASGDVGWPRSPTRLRPKRWLLGTHQGSVEADHVQAYLNEFTFRFNRRGARHRGLLFRRLLEQAVDVGPVTYRSLVVNPAPKRTRPAPPPARRVAPPTLDITVPARPWRRTNM